MTGFDDTVFAPATVPGTGAITVIRVSGDDAFSLVDKLFHSSSGSVAQAKGYSILYGTLLDPETGSQLDDVLVGVFRAPHSYTGEDCVEISCHASPYVASRLMELLSSLGARSAERVEFTRIAFLNGKMDLAQAEAVADLISSGSEAAHRIAVNQLKGGYSAELANIRASLVEITSLLELELDFSEEDVEFADRSRLCSLVESAKESCDRLAGSFAVGNAIKNGVPVVISGRPNVGKSTLLNALVGEDRAIVSDIPGTTRDSIDELIRIDGIDFRITDTAGLRESDETIESLGISRALRLLSNASIVLAMVDATASDQESIEFLSSLLEKVDPEKQKLLVLVNKIDCNKNVKAINKFVLSLDNKVDLLCISAARGEGLAELKSYLSGCVKQQISRFNAASDSSILVTNERHRAALQAASDSLARAMVALRSGIASDLLSQDLRAAIHHLGTITGSITTDEILGTIFSRFCIGK